MIILCLYSPNNWFWIVFVEPKFVIDYLQMLKSSEESLREQVWRLHFFCFMKSNYFLYRISSMFCSCYQLEKAKKKEAAFIVTFAKREQEIAELKVYIFSHIFFLEVCRVHKIWFHFASTNFIFYQMRTH